MYHILYARLVQQRRRNGFCIAITQNGANTHSLLFALNIIYIYMYRQILTSVKINIVALHFWT